MPTPGDRETHPTGPERVFGAWRDRIEVRRPAGIGRIPPRMAVFAHDPKPTMGRGRPGASGCNREDAQRSGAPVEVEPVCVTPNDDETACRPSVASLGRRQPSRSSRSLAVQGRDGRRAHHAVDLESRMALEATDRCDAPGSEAAVERAGRVPVRAQEELGLGDVPALSPECEGARTEAMAAVRAEGAARHRPGNPVYGQPMPALEDAHGGDGARADYPVDRAPVEAATLQRDLQRGDP